MKPIEADRMIAEFFKDDIRNVKEKLGELVKFCGEMADVLLVGSHDITDYNDCLSRIQSFLTDISKEVDFIALY